MKLIFPVTVLFIAALACGRFGANSTANSNNASNANLKPAPPVKAVDVPAMIGKSGDEIKKMIPTAPDFDQYDQKSWTLPQGTLTVYFLLNEVPWQTGKPSHMVFDCKVEVINGQAVAGFDSAERLGDLLGVQLRGTTPTQSYPSAGGDSVGSIKWENIAVNGKRLCGVRMQKILGSYKTAHITFCREDRPRAYE